MEDLLKIEQGARFEKVLKRLKISQVALSQLTGLSQPLISQICVGKREITRNTERIIAEILPDVNLSWVFTGEGNMLLSEASKKNWVDKEEEAEVVYEADPLAALRWVLGEHERRLKELEEEVAELRKTKK